MTQELRSRLERWKFSYIHTAGELRDQPATDHGEVSASTGNIELDLKESTEFKETYKTYISMMSDELHRENDLRLCQQGRTLTAAHQ